MKWYVNVKVGLSIDYDDIEANSREEAEQRATDRAREDIEFNNCECDDNYTVYGCYSDDEEEPDDV